VAFFYVRRAQIVNTCKTWYSSERFLIHTATTHQEIMVRKLVIFSFIIASIGIGAFIALTEKDWIDWGALDMYKRACPSVILDDEGAIIASFEVDKRSPVSYNKLPKVLVDAFVSTEDHKFFTHQGISVRGIVRSFAVNLLRGRVVQGASTITQQLTRLMFLNHERTWWRKVKEVIIAFQLERQLSKEQIFELYVNNIYFGRGIYGVQAACQRFWNIPLDEITTAQAATLAAVAASAALYSPLNAPANAVKRRNIVLSLLHKRGCIDAETYAAAIKEKLQIRDFGSGSPIRLYIQEHLRTWAENQFGKDALYRQGLRIKTTINSDMQEKAEKAFTGVVHQIRTKFKDPVNGGMLSIVPSTGAIKVMIGGYDFKESQYNRAFQAQRQIGSTFKPMLYALALKAGVEMESVFIDEPLEVVLPNGKIYSPQNWDNKFHGSMSLAKAITTSCNTIAVKLFLKIGAHYCVPWTKQFGITRSLNNYPSAALGTAEATVNENVAAFNVFANNGLYVKPYLVEWVKDSSGNKVWVAQHSQQRILDSVTTSRMVQLLSLRMQVAKRQWGDGWISGESIGKTGSTNAATTTWFVGSTPALTTAIYVGCDNNKPMGSRLLASRTTFPIWKDFYKQLPATQAHFYRDPSLTPYYFNWSTGLETDKFDQDQNVVMLLR
jgi:penicillin-binding protein 1A